MIFYAVLTSCSSTPRPTPPPPPPPLIERSGAEAALLLAATSQVPNLPIQTARERVGRCAITPSKYGWGAARLVCRLELGRDVPVPLVRDDIPGAQDGGHHWFGVGNPGTAELVFPLLRPDSDILQTAATVTGEPAETIQSALAEHGLDLQAATLAGAPIRDETGKHTSRTWTVEGTGRRTIPRTLAQRIWPDATAGEEVRLGSGDAFQALVTSFDTLAHPEEAYLHLPMIALYQQTTQPVDGPAALSTLGWTFRPLHAEPAFGVLAVDLPSSSIETAWEQAAQRFEETGYWPVVVGPNDPTAYAGGWDSMAERVQRKEDDAAAGLTVRGLRFGDHVAATPNGILKYASTIEPRTLVAANRTYSDFAPTRGTESSGAPIDNAPLGVRSDLATLALVPVDAAWKAAAWLPHLGDAGEATPSMAEVAAVSKRWEEHHDAVLFAIQPATVIWRVRQPIADDTLEALAVEHCYFSPEGGSSDVTARSGQLSGRYWTAWWD